MFPSTSVIRILGTEPIRTNCWWPLFQSVVIKQGWLKWPNSSEKLHWKHDSDMTFVLDLCINMRKVTVSSSLHTDLMFSKFSPLRLQQRLRWISHASSHLWFICFQFSLRSVAFCFFYQYSNVFASGKTKKKMSIFIFLCKLEKCTLEQVDGNTQTDVVRGETLLFSLVLTHFTSSADVEKTSTRSDTTWLYHISCVLYVCLSPCFCVYMLCCEVSKPSVGVEVGQVHRGRPWRQQSVV